MTTLELLQKTRAAMSSIAAAGAEKKNALLLAMADSLEAHCAEILAANAEDMAAARGRITDVMLDRLKLDENRIAGMANGIRDTVRLPDHTGRVLSEVVRPNGIIIDKVQVPLGLVAIIYESRPNVTSDAAALAVKSGNVCMLRSGKEAYRSARAIVAALKAGVCCLIICQADVDAHLTDYDGGTCIISTPLDARRVGRLIFQAMPVEHVSKTGDIICFHLADYLDDVRELMLKSRYRCYPVLDENDHVVGTLSRFHLLRPKRKRVVLVDHNEAAQSVHGLDQVEILEIIDHHRLADIQTGQPISVRNEPVGSTNTIITSMYQEHGVTPSPKMAGLMAAAILSDTVMFKSPTCTKKDIAMAERLARIARISLKDLGRELFSSTSDGKSAEELLGTDYKEFHISGQTIGVGQITCVDSSKLVERRDEFIAAMEKVKQNSNCDLVILMITDVLLDGSHIFYVGSDDVMQEAFSTVPKDKHMFLPKVMSRKKQIIPMLTAMWG